MKNKYVNVLVASSMVLTFVIPNGGPVLARENGYEIIDSDVEIEVTDTFKPVVEVEVETETEVEIEEGIEEVIEISDPKPILEKLQVAQKVEIIKAANSGDFVAGHTGIDLSAVNGVTFETTAGRPMTSDEFQTFANIYNGPNVFELAVIDLINQARAHYGLHAVTYSSGLAMSSRLQTEYLAHNWGPSYTSPHQNTMFGSSDALRDAATIGSSGAWNNNGGQGHLTPEQLVNSLLNSPGHRENLLSPTVNFIGAGSTTSTAPGSYGVMHYIMFTQNNIEFGWERREVVEEEVEDKPEAPEAPEVEVRFFGNTSIPFPEIEITGAQLAYGSPAHGLVSSTGRYFDEGMFGDMTRSEWFSYLQDYLEEMYYETGHLVISRGLIALITHVDGVEVTEETLLGLGLSHKGFLALGYEYTDAMYTIEFFLPYTYEVVGNKGEWGGNVARTGNVFNLTFANNPETDGNETGGDESDGSETDGNESDGNEDNSTSNNNNNGSSNNNNGNNGSSNNKNRPNNNLPQTGTTLASIGLLGAGMVTSAIVAKKRKSL